MKARNLGVDIWRARDGWRWRLRARNGRIVGESGEAFVSQRNAKRSLGALLKVMVPAYLEALGREAHRAIGCACCK